MSRSERLHAGDLVIGPQVSVEGRIVLSGRGMVRIEGKFSGTIRCRGTVIIAEGAVVHADIEAGALVAAGVFEGRAEVEDQVRVTASAEVRADCAGMGLVLEPGARFNGKFERRQPLSVPRSEAEAGITGEEHDRRLPAS